MWSCLLLANSPLWAQTDRPLPNSSPDTSQVAEVGVEEFDDELNVRYFYADKPGEEFEFNDTLMDYFQQYDPIRMQEVDYGHLGNLGSAHQALQYQTPFRRGLDLGFHQFDLYTYESADLPFYKLDKAFTNLFFTQGSTQLENMFRGQFSRNFSKNLNYSLHYQRINNTGLYRSLKAQNTAFVTGFWYHSPKGKYNAYITYAYNEIRQRDNGGIIPSLVTENNRDTEFNIPVSLNEGAESRYAIREFALLHTYNLVGKPDSTQQQPSRSFLIRHQLNYRPTTYKFFDENPDDDNDFYDTLRTDTRGLRYFIRHRSLSNSIRISTGKARSAEGSNLKKQKDLLEIALHHRLHLLGQEAADTTLNDLFLSGRWEFSPSDRLDVKTYAHLGLWNQAGDYRLEGYLSFDLPSIGSLTAQAVTQAYAPAFLTHRHYLSGQQIWNNSFDKTFENSLSGQLNIPKLGLRLGVQYNLVTNMTYFDSLGLARQAGNSVNILQFRAGHRLKWRALNFDNEVVLQEIGGDILRLPTLFSKHSLFVSFKIFRNFLDVQAGADLRFSTAYLAQRYQPATGQFQLQNQLETNTYPALDAFFNFKVRRLRFFVKMENLNSYFTNDFLYLIAYNPNPYAYFRMGLSWQLLH